MVDVDAADRAVKRKVSVSIAYTDKPVSATNREYVYVLYYSRNLLIVSWRPILPASRPRDGIGSSARWAVHQLVHRVLGIVQISSTHGTPDGFSLFRLDIVEVFIDCGVDPFPRHASCPELSGAVTHAVF